MGKMKIKKGDTRRVIAGTDKGKEGKRPRGRSREQPRHR